MGALETSSLFVDNYALFGGDVSATGSLSGKSLLVDEEIVSREVRTDSLFLASPSFKARDSILSWDGEQVGYRTVSSLSAASIYTANGSLDGDRTVTFDDNDLTFTTGDGDLLVDATTLVVDGSENRVGIGTTTPANLLQVKKGVNSETLVSLENTGTSGANVLSITSGSTGTTDIVDIQSSAFVVQGDGKVGLGTDDPQRILDVEGGVAIGATYSGTTASPTNGLLVEGSSRSRNDYTSSCIAGNRRNRDRHVIYRHLASRRSVPCRPSSS